MATNHIHIAASRDHVFAVLANPENYGDWVVGSDTIRDADPSWPKPGARFHHRVGIGLLKVNDHTEAIDVDPPRRLVMHARARPLFGTAKVAMLLAEQDGGTRVTMIETAGDRLSRVVLNRLTDPLIHMRNRESLRRLKRIAETGTANP
jgi:uncharacterized protein YndB with AHSA1/START domain